MSLSDVPQGLLEEPSDYSFHSDIEYEQAYTRLIFQKFIEETYYGKIFANKIKNKRDQEILKKMIHPAVDDKTVLICNDINRVFKEPFAKLKKVA